MQLLIVNYHYFRESTYSLGIYPTNALALKMQIKALAKQHTFISQLDFLAFLDHKKPELMDKKCCLITWDDGLKEQINAFNYLVNNGIPSVYYVSTMPIWEKKVLNVHKLQFIRTQWDDKELVKRLNADFGMNTYNFDQDSLNNQYRYDDEIGRKVKYYINFVLTAKQKNEALQHWFIDLAGSEEKFAEEFYMSKDDLKTLATNSSLGAHGHSHLPLANQTDKIAQNEVNSCINLLESETGQPVRSFSYPFGGRDAVNLGLESLFENTSIKYSLTMWRGYNDLTSQVNPYFLKRVDTNDAPGGKNYGSL